MAHVGNVYAYNKLYYVSPDNKLPTGFSFDSYAQLQEVDLTGYFPLGSTVTGLSESPNAETSESAYISNKTKSTTVDSYNFVFSGTAEMIPNDEATMVLYNKPYKKQTGDMANVTLLVVDEWNEVEEGSSIYTARLFRVSVAITEFTGEATEKISFDFDLASVKDPILGVYDDINETFHIDDNQQKPVAP